jgi:hypothetical protein
VSVNAADAGEMRWERRRKEVCINLKFYISNDTDAGEMRWERGPRQKGYGLLPLWINIKRV